MTPPERDLWTLFPVAALLSFAGWVALMVETADVGAAMVLVALFLGLTWRARVRWQQFRDAVAARRKSISEQHKRQDLR
jgi:cell division protein FtsW (lipid II flippase)